jgi:hypothetical protein
MLILNLQARFLVRVLRRLQFEPSTGQDRRLLDVFEILEGEVAGLRETETADAERQGRWMKLDHRPREPAAARISSVRSSARDEETLPGYSLDDAASRLYRMATRIIAYEALSSA